MALCAVSFLSILFSDLDTITSYPLSSPRIFWLDLMIKHDFLFSLDLDLLYLFSSLDRNSNLIIIVRDVGILSHCGLDSVSY